MALANIKITGAILTPNPVQTGKQYIISVEISQAIFVLGDDNCRIMDSDGVYILAPDSDIYVISTGTPGEYLADENGSIIETVEEE